MGRRLVGLLVGALLLAPGSAAADTLEPAQWPDELAFGSATNALRFGGADRYWTSTSIALALRGGGQHPFDSPDTADGGGATLAEGSGWWGAGTCPRAVIVVAGDTPADAIAASALSDPTNRSDEPRLERVAAADPLFDPIGGFDRVDTAFAPILVTTSARSGAAALAPSARVAATDLRTGGCRDAREAIVVGGPAAVPKAVEGELVSLGYEEVFRVAGTDRYDTAARIATALGTEPVPPGAECADGRVDDGTASMAFYANSVIEYRADATSCELHGRTVVLADGEIGADALAAGWWTSFWQVPVLLVAADGSLPPATRTALQTLPIDTIVVLGGPGRVPVATEDEAVRLAGATPGRFQGRDRYETSVLTAAAFGGWHPTGAPEDFDGDRFCVAASAGRLGGWPDALAAGPLCGRLSATAAEVRSPSRTMEPVSAATGAVPAPRSSHDAVPMLLVPVGATPSAAVSGLLSAAFPTSGGWCTGGAPPSCRAPGFAVSFGGSAVVSDAALDAVSALAGGGDPAAPSPSPAAVEPFVTGLDLQPVYTGGAAGTIRTCVARGDVTGARWLAAFEDAGLDRLVGSLDLVTAAAYDGGVADPVCAGSPGPDATLVAVSGAGRHSSPALVGVDPALALRMSDAMRHDGPLTSGGADGTSTTAGDATTWRFRDAPPGTLEVTDRGEEWTVAAASVSITLTRDGGDRARFGGVIRIDGSQRGVEAQVRGEALLVGAQWELAGRATTADAVGGFRATLHVNATPERGDDVLEWRLDGHRRP